MTSQVQYGKGQQAQNYKGSSKGQKSSGGKGASKGPKGNSLWPEPRPEQSYHHKGPKGKGKDKHKRSHDQVSGNSESRAATAVRID